MTSDKSNGNDSRKDENGARNTHPWSLSIPDKLREMIEDTADAEGKSRSRWVREKLEQVLGIAPTTDNDPPAE